VSIGSTTKHGTDWRADEVAVAVAEYFLMLAHERAGRSYIKAEHWRRVMEQTGRVKGAVEFKFGNISAVLEALGIQWVRGYKPARHYQDALIDAVERQLMQHADFVQPHFAEPAAEFLGQDVFVPPPEPDPKDPAARVPAMRRLIGKFDPAARDHRNRTLGQAGERFVLDFERECLERAGCSTLAGKVRWISYEDGDGYGYDILSFTPRGEERLLEVKTTCGHERTPFWITRRECEIAAEKQEIFRIRRVFHFGNKAQMFELPPPLEDRVSLTAACYMASFRS
jgi:uncharacterized protein DUF3883